MSVSTISRANDSRQTGASAQISSKGNFTASGVIRPRRLGERRADDADFANDETTPKARPRLKVRGQEQFKPLRTITVSKAPEAEVEVVEPASSDAVPRKPSKSYRAVLLSLLQKGRAPFVPVLLLGLIVGSITSVSIYRQLFERDAASVQVATPPAPPRSSLDATSAAAFREAMEDARAGRFALASEKLDKLDLIHPAVPSVAFVSAVTALQGGDPDLADLKAEESIARGERVADALAVRAVVAAQKRPASLVNPLLRSEELLRQAIATDPANPYPHFELANTLRYQRKTDEALAEIRLARALLHPMDSHLVMDVTTDLLSLEGTPPESLVVDQAETSDPRKLISQAYILMRQGDFDRAASLLRAAEAVMAPDVFDYLVNDPALRRFSTESALSAFYGN